MLTTTCHHGDPCLCSDEPEDSLPDCCDFPMCQRPVTVRLTDNTGTFGACRICAAEWLARTIKERI